MSYYCNYVLENVAATSKFKINMTSDFGPVPLITRLTGVEELK